MVQYLGSADGNAGAEADQQEPDHGAVTHDAEDLKQMRRRKWDSGRVGRALNHKAARAFATAKAKRQKNTKHRRHEDKLLKAQIRGT